MRGRKTRRSGRFDMGGSSEECVTGTWRMKTEGIVGDVGLCILLKRRYAIGIPDSLNWSNNSIECLTGVGSRI